VIGVEPPESGIAKDFGTYLVARRAGIAGKRELEVAFGHVAIV
jgi:hypothetical protein